MTVNLYNLALDLEEEFTKLKREKTKAKYYRAPSSAFSHFQKAAVICDRLEADPRDFVESLFDKREAKDIYPTMLGSELIMPKYYSEFVAKLKAEEPHITDYFDLYVNRLTALMDNNSKSAVEVLLDETVDLPAWFRVVILKTNNPDVYKKYITEARQQVDEQTIKFCINKGLDAQRFYGTNTEIRE